MTERSELVGIARRGEFRLSSQNTAKSISSPFLSNFRKPTQRLVWIDQLYLYWYTTTRVQCIQFSRPSRRYQCGCDVDNFLASASSETSPKTTKCMNHVWHSIRLKTTVAEQQDGWRTMRPHVGNGVPKMTYKLDRVVLAKISEL